MLSEKEKKKEKKPANCMVPLKWNIQNGQIHRERKEISSSRG